MYREITREWLEKHGWKRGYSENVYKKGTLTAIILVNTCIVKDESK